MAFPVTSSICVSAKIILCAFNYSLENADWANKSFPTSSLLQLIYIHTQLTHTLHTHKLRYTVFSLNVERRF